MTYNGLESCIINNQSYENESGTSRGEGCVSDSFDDDGCSRRRGRLVIYHEANIDRHGSSVQERAVVASRVLVGRV